MDHVTRAINRMSDKLLLETSFSPDSPEVQMAEFRFETVAKAFLCCGATSNGPLKLVDSIGLRTFLQ